MNSLYSASSMDNWIFTLEKKAAIVSKCCFLIFILVAGTDDDLPPSYPNSRSNRGSGRVSGNGRAIVPASSYARASTDMEAQIQQLEQEAYCSVLRAFKAQSDAITWVETLSYSLLIWCL